MVFLSPLNYIKLRSHPTQAIHACLWRQIPLAKPPKRGIVYLSRMGRCYGRLTPIESKFRGLPRSQHNLSPEHRITTVLWNHLHSLIEIAGLDPYEGVLHTGSPRHADLVSDLLEEFCAPIVDSLTLHAINRGIMDVNKDFDYPENACYLNTTGCRKFLGLLIRHMEEELDFNGTPQPRWAILNAQVRSFTQFIRPIHKLN